MHRAGGIRLILVLPALLLCLVAPDRVVASSGNFRPAVEAQSVVSMPVFDFGDEDEDDFQDYEGIGRPDID